MNKKLIRLTESDLHRIVKESVNRILNESNDTKIVDGNFGTITYLQLFDYMQFEGRFPYVVEYSSRAYFVPGKGVCQLANPIERKGFKTRKECIEFCQENGIEIIKEFNVNHSLSKGMPDTRSIKPWSSPKDFS